MYQSILFFHVLAATVWTGGHIVLAVGILPNALIHHDFERIIRFEEVYERIGLPALIIQVITGLWLAYQLIPNVSNWFEMANPISRLIVFKLCLLAITIALAVDARLRLIPTMATDKLNDLAWHIITVTVLSILFIVVGIAFRFGGL